MTPEQLIPRVVKALKAADKKFYTIPANQQWLDYEIWLAQMVIALVEERAKRIHYSGDKTVRFDDCVLKGRDIKNAYRELGLSPDDWAWLKEKVGG